MGIPHGCNLNWDTLPCQGPHKESLAWSCDGHLGLGLGLGHAWILHEAVFEKSDDDDDGSPNGCTGVHTMEVCRHEGMARAQAIYPYVVI